MDRFRNIRFYVSVTLNFGSRLGRRDFRSTGQIEAARVGQLGGMFGPVRAHARAQQVLHQRLEALPRAEYDIDAPLSV